MFFRILVLLILFITLNAQNKNDITISYSDFERKIEISKSTKKLLEKYNKNVLGDFKTLKKGNLEISGYVTGNFSFFKEVMLPDIKKHLNQLMNMKKTDAINYITLFSHEIFRNYFSKDFYRWGGDILDLDDPQSESIRHKYRFGLDCSGFATMAYQIAEYLGIINFELEESLFSSKGFKSYCKKNGFKDKGGINGTSNNFRLDTSELFELGRVIFQVNKGETPSDKQLKMLQSGDLVGRNGHVGIIVMIEDKPYYLESGGWVVPKNGGLPCKAKESIIIFATLGNVEVRRCLDDNK